MNSFFLIEKSVETETKEPSLELKSINLNKDYELDKFNYGLFDSFFRFVRKKPKIFVLMVTSLVMTFTLVILVPIMQRHRDSLLKQESTTRFNNLARSLYSNLCFLKRNFLIENYFFIMFSVPLTCFLYFRNSFYLKQKSGSKQKMSKFRCMVDLKLIVPMNPFGKNNRLITCIIYAAYIHNITKIFEFSLSDFNWLDMQRLDPNSSNETDSLKSLINKLVTFQSFNVYGILIDLLLKILNVFIIGFHFYPVLLCVEFKRRSKLSHFLCSVYVWLLFVYYVFVNELCVQEVVNVGEMLKASFGSAKEFVQGFLTDDFDLSSIVLSINTLKNKTQVYKVADKLKNYTSNATSIKGLIKQSGKTIKLEELVFYIILCLIAVNLTVECVLIALNQILKLGNFNLVGLFNAKQINEASRELEYESDSDYEIARVKNELNYTAHIFRGQQSGKVSYLKHVFEKYVYKRHKYFRFSKQFLNVHVIGFILIYYATFFIIRASEHISYVCTTAFGLLLNLLLKKYLTAESILKVVDTIYVLVGDVMLKTCLLTSSIYVVQLMFGIKKYQEHVLEAYRGVYSDVPSPKKFSNAKLASGSLHYR